MRPLIATLASRSTPRRWKGLSTLLSAFFYAPGCCDCYADEHLLAAIQLAGWLGCCSTFHLAPVDPISPVRCTRSRPEAPYGSRRHAPNYLKVPECSIYLPIPPLTLRSPRRTNCCSTRIPARS